MHERFAPMLAVGGKSNSLGRVTDVIDCVLQDKSRLDELYNYLFDEDPWLRMRAADALEKVCRSHPDWLLPYIDRFAADLANSTQASIQWHLAQIYRQVTLTAPQKQFAVNWLAHILSTKDVDWIVAANAMDTLAQFTREGVFPKAEMVRRLEIQKQHASNAVVKRAVKLLDTLAS